MCTIDIYRKGAPAPMLLKESPLCGQGHLWGAREGGKGRSQNRRLLTPTHTHTHFSNLVSLPVELEALKPVFFSPESQKHTLWGFGNQHRAGDPAIKRDLPRVGRLVSIASGIQSPMTQDKEDIWQPRERSCHVSLTVRCHTVPSSSKSISGCYSQPPSKAL